MEKRGWKSVNNASPSAQELEQAYEEIKDLPREKLVKLEKDFISTCVSLIKNGIESKESSKALRILLRAVKEDCVFETTFSKALIKKCKIERLLASSDEDEVNTALDFTSFILRKSPEIDYTDLSEESGILHRIKRGESSRQWGDLEDLNNAQQQLFKAFEDHGKTVGSAFQEIYNHIEKIRGQLSEDIKSNREENIRLNNYIEAFRDKQPGPTTDKKSALESVAKIDSTFNHFNSKIDEIELFLNDKIIKRIDLLEQHEGHFEEQIKAVINKLKFLNQKSSKIEEQLNENHENGILKTDEIYQTMDDIKKLVQKKVSRLEQLVIQRENQDIPTYADMKVAFQKIKKLEENVLAIRTYQHELDEVFGLQSKEIDSLIKMTSNNNYIKIREIEASIDNSKKEFTDYQDSSDMKLKEILKDMEAVKQHRKKLEALEWAEDDSAKLSVLVAESEQLWTFVQGFVDEQSITKTKIMKNLKLDLTERMNAFEWVSRNAIYLTPQALSHCVNVFKLQYSHEDPEISNRYILGSHQSHLAQTVCSKLKKLCKVARNDENEQKIFSQLSILEPALINDMNLELVLTKNMHGVFLQLINTKALMEEITKPTTQSLKYLMRCLASSLRSEDSILMYLNEKDCIKKLGVVLKYVNDQEILANASKCIRLCCKNKANIKQIQEDCSDLPNILVDTIIKNVESLVITHEVLVALTFFTAVVDAVPHLQLDNLKVLVQLHKDTSHEKVKSNIKVILLQCARILEYEDELGKLNAGYILTD
ncbi:unnamed protein product [Moneuplotes crassus]|uniref:Uncharacterized protein n=1 Tax=Euplotes crassus TaxID=5936 RepID=A0AAD2D9S0_EUPCR|nr:unnamed protein product [Moneuplotes crassus]